MFDALKRRVKERNDAANQDVTPIKKIREGDGYDQVEQNRIRKEEDSRGQTTRRSMGEGKLKLKKGGSIRGDGCAQRGKTKGRMI